MKFPYRGVIITEFGGTSFKRAGTIAEAEMKAKQQAGEIGNIRVTKMYVSDTKGNVIKDLMMKQNPAPKRKTAARTQKAAESYVRRPSQITKKAPSKRLKKRRTVNLQSARGVFPNPKARALKWDEFGPVENRSYQAITDHLPGGRSQFSIIKARRGWELSDFGITSNGWSNHGGFKIPASAKKYARELVSGIKQNPDVHFDIDVNSHNARGAKARTRTNPTKRKIAPKAKRYFIVTDHSSGILYFDGTGFSKLKSSAVDFRTKENVVPRATALADFFNRPMKVMEE